MQLANWHDMIIGTSLPYFHRSMTLFPMVAVYHRETVHVLCGVDLHNQYKCTEEVVCLRTEWQEQDLNTSTKEDIRVKSVKY